MSFVEHLAAAAEPVRDTVRAALENGTPLRIAGARTWLDAGRPVRATETISVDQSGVVDYVAGDLTLTVRAGTSLAEIERTTAQNAQWLPLDPGGAADATIGATVATASYGPLSHAFGSPRDQVIGLGFVTGKGDYVRSGGRVVKNVAGFDLTRLVTGAWGTLGVITDVSLRLRARPEVDSSVAVVLSEEPLRLRRALDEIAQAVIAPLALELIHPTLSAALGQARDTLLAVRLGGNPRMVAAQRETLAPFGEILDLDTAFWQRLRAVEPARSIVVRYSTAIADFPALWLRLTRQLEGGRAFIHGTPARGIVRCVIPAEDASQVTQLQAPQDGLSRIFERLPDEMWGALAPSPMNQPLMRRVRDAFDPAMILNPGILGEPAS